VNFSIIKKARIATVVTALVGFILSGLLLDFGFAGGFLATALWGAAGFWFIEGLVRLALLPPGQSRSRGRILALVGGKLALYAIALWALLKGVVAPIPAMLGFSLLLVALVVTTLLERPKLQASRSEVQEDDEQ